MNILMFLCTTAFIYTGNYSEMMPIISLTIRMCEGKYIYKFHKNTTLLGQVQNQISKSLKETKSIPLTHQYLTFGTPILNL